jgi:membrane-associated protease RseP (regulator of RpoE activity)
MSSSSHTVFIAAPPRLGGHGPLVASLAVLLASGVLPLAAQQQRVDVVRVRTPLAEPADSTERLLRKWQHQLDSLARVYNEHDDLTMAERRRVEEELGRTIKRLDDLSSRMSRAPDRMMRPGDQIRILLAPQAVERAAASMSRAMMQVREAEQAAPRGWVGIVAEGPNLSRVEDGQLLVRYFAYPRVASVDPSSPAQRAGLAPNDTLLAYDGVDVSENVISFTRLLRPNAKVSIRFRRDGKVREIPVTVAPVPYRIVQRRDDESRARESWDVAVMPEAPSFPRVPMPAMAPGAPMRVTVRATTPAAAPRAPEGAEAPRPMVAYGFSYNSGVIGVAGAQLSTISEGLGKALGVSSGVLVTTAPVGSPANESGLVDGDVISKVGGQVVRRATEVRDLVALAAENGDHAVELELVRQKRVLKLLLKW